MFAYRQLFDLCLLLLDMLVLPQKLFVNTKSVNIRKRGRPPIHEGTIYFPSYFHYFKSLLHSFLGYECIGQGGGM